MILRGILLCSIFPKATGMSINSLALGSRDVLGCKWHSRSWPPRSTVGDWRNQARTMQELYK